MAGAMTLNEYLKIADTPLLAGVIQNLLRYSPTMGMMSFRPAKGLKVKANRWKTLPSPTWRDLNEDHGTGQGKTEEIEEALYDIGHYIDIDKLQMRASDHIVDPMELQVEMTTMAIGYEFNDKVINGDPAVDPKAVWGVKYRISKLPARQTIYHDAAGNGTGAETHVLATDATMQTFLDKVDELVKVVGGAPTQEPASTTVLLMNEKTYNGIRSILRRQKLLDTTKDMFGREIINYMGAKLIDVGLKADAATEIITNTENPGDGGADATSIYAVKLGEAEQGGFQGMQLYPLEVNDIGMLESGTAFRTVVDWPIGFLGLSNFYAAKLCGFEMAAA